MTKVHGWQQRWKMINQMEERSLGAQERGNLTLRSHASPWLTTRHNLWQHRNVSGDMGCTAGGSPLMVVWIGDGGGETRCRRWWDAAAPSLVSPPCLSSAPLNDTNKSNDGSLDISNDGYGGDWRRISLRLWLSMWLVTLMVFLLWLPSKPKDEEMGIDRKRV